MESLVYKERLKTQAGGMTRTRQRRRPIIVENEYSLVVGRLGKVYDGYSRSEALRQFRLFMIESRNARSNSAGVAVTLFKNYEILREHNPPGFSAR